MNYDKFTEKSREALGEAQQMAAKMNHQELTGLHLLAALLKNPAFKNHCLRYQRFISFFQYN